MLSRRAARSSNHLNYLFLGMCLSALTFQVVCNFISYHSPSPTELTSELAAGGVEKPLVPSDNLRRLSEGEDGTALNVVPQKYRFGASPHNGRLRVLLGILSADFFNDQVYRKRHRSLFQIWNDERVCSLPEFKSKPADQRYLCELIYTFVIGANPKAAPELVDGSRPMEVRRPIRGVSVDLNEPDMTLLNIRENMNEGKSQTWMHYGAQIAEEYDLDYVAKCDTDTLFHLHEFFHFAYKNMPPAPYNSMMYIGALRDKAYWPKKNSEKERIRLESYFGNVYEGVHLYVAGQLYIMATDLAKFVGKEALENSCRYCEGHEDHDISAMAFHSPEPVKLVCVGRSHRFWEHPVKGEPRWKRIWAREQARMVGKPFEGKMYTTNSTCIRGCSQRRQQSTHLAKSEES
jgi:Galactosyltransferase